MTEYRTPPRRRHSGRTTYARSWTHSSRTDKDKAKLDKWDVIRRGSSPPVASRSAAPRHLRVVKTKPLPPWTPQLPLAILRSAGNRYACKSIFFVTVQAALSSHNTPQTGGAPIYVLPFTVPAWLRSTEASR